MKTKKFFVVLTSAFLLSGCQTGGGNTPSLGEEVDYKTFVKSVLDSVEKNEFFVKDGVKSNKAISASAGISLSLKTKTSGVEKIYYGASVSGKVNGQVDLQNDIAKADFSYKVSLNDMGKEQSQEDSFSGQLQAEDGKLYAIDLKEKTSGVLLEEFQGFKYYLDLIPNELEEGWKDKAYEALVSSYDEMMENSEEFKELMESGLVKYYVDGDSFTAKISGKASIDVPITKTSSGDGESTSTSTEPLYTIQVDVSGSETVKIDLTNGNESYSMNGKLGLTLTVKDASEPVSFIDDATLNNGDSVLASLNGKLNISIKDSDVSLEKVSL